MNIGERLVLARGIRQMSQVRLASKCGWHKHGHNRISGYETGYREPNTAAIWLMAEALEVPPEWLQFGVGKFPTKRNNAKRVDKNK